GLVAAKQGQTEGEGGERSLRHCLLDRRTSGDSKATSAASLAPDHSHADPTLWTERHAAPLDRDFARLAQLELELAQHRGDRDARLEQRERGPNAAPVAAAKRQVLVGLELLAEEPLGLEGLGFRVDVRALV